MSKVFPSEAKIREVMHEPNVVFRCVAKESKSCRLGQGALDLIMRDRGCAASMIFQGQDLGEVAELVKGAAL